MKANTILRSLSILSAAALFAACANDDPAPAAGPDRTPVRFRAEAQTANPAPKHDATRTVEGPDGQTEWTEGDRVGVFMLAADGSIPGHILNEAGNIAYAVAPATGGLEPDGMSIYYPEDQAVDFVAYSPYNGQIERNYTINMEIVDQTTPEKQAAIDMLYSDNARGIGSGDQPVALNFRHLMAKLRFDITLSDELAGGSVTHLSLNRQPNRFLFDLRTRSIPDIAIESSVEALKLAQPAPETDAAFTALVVPKYLFSGRTITVTVDGVEYTGEIPDSDRHEGNTLYTYPVTVRKAGVVVGPSQIGGWTVIDGGTGDATIVEQGE